jgi:hypothetical protein
VVTVGLTVVEPLAEVEVKVPGVMAMLVAPVVLQVSVLLVPVLMVVGLAAYELILGLEIVTPTFLVVAPAGLMAVSV